MSSTPATFSRESLADGDGLADDPLQAPRGVEPAHRRHMGGDDLEPPAAIAKPPLYRRLLLVLSNVAWVVRDAWSAFRGSMIGIIALNLAGLGAGAASVGGLLLFAKAVESGHPMHILHWAVHVSRDAWTLAAAAIVFGVLGIISAVALYAGDWLIIRTVRRQHRRCAMRVFEIVIDPACNGWQALVAWPPRNGVNTLAGATSRFTAFALRDAVRLLVPLVTFIISVVALVKLHPLLTVLLVPLATAYSVPLYRMNRAVANHHRHYVRAMPALRRETTRSLADLLDAQTLLADRRETLSGMLSGSDYERTMDSFYARMLADKRVQLLNALLFVACLVAVLIFYGISISEQNRTISGLVAYLVALRFAVTTLRQATSLVTNLSRFLPEYRAYSSFITGVDHLRSSRASSTAPPIPSTITIRAGTASKWDSHDAVTCSIASPLIVFMPDVPTLDRQTALLAILGRSASPVFDLLRHVSVITPLESSAAGTLNTVAPAAPSHGAAPRVVAGQLAAFRDHLLKGTPDQASFVRESLGVVFARNPDLKPEIRLAPYLQHAAALVIDQGRIVAAGDRAWLDAHVPAINRYLTAREALAREIDEDDEDE